MPEEIREMLDDVVKPLAEINSFLTEAVPYIIGAVLLAGVWALVRMGLSPVDPKDRQQPF